MRRRQLVAIKPIRWRAARRKRNLSRKYKVRGIALMLGLLIWLILAGFCMIDDRFDPILDELAEYEGRAVIVQTMNQTIARRMQEKKWLYQNLYDLERNSDGKVLSVTANTAAMNAACLDLIEAIDAALSSLPEKVVYIPFGTLTGISVLNNLGPGWLLSFQPEGYTEGNISEFVETVAINQTRYCATLELHVSINMVLDGKNRVLHADTNVPIASVLVRGDTPLYYGSAF